jgi:hypothetical protein
VDILRDTLGCAKPNPNALTHASRPAAPAHTTASRLGKPYCWSHRAHPSFLSSDPLIPFAGTAFPIGEWPSLSDVLSAALSPGSPDTQPKRHRSTELKRRQLQDKLAHNKGAPLLPTIPADLPLELPLARPCAPRARLKQHYLKQQPKHAHVKREAPRTTFYRRLGRRNT